MLVAARPGLIVIDCSTSLIADQRVRSYLGHLIDA